MIDRDRLRCPARGRGPAASPSSTPSRPAYAGPRAGLAPGRGADELDAPVGRALPALRRRGHRFVLPERRRRSHLCRFLPGRHGRHLAGHCHRPDDRRPRSRRRREESPRCSPTGRCHRCRQAADPTLWTAGLADRDDRDRCQPFQYPSGLVISPDGRRVTVFNWCYHGTVDETFAVLNNEVERSRLGPDRWPRRRDHRRHHQSRRVQRLSTRWPPRLHRGDVNCVLGRAGVDQHRHRPARRRVSRRVADTHGPRQGRC